MGIFTRRGRHRSDEEQAGSGEGRGAREERDPSGRAASEAGRVPTAGGATAARSTSQGRGAGGAIPAGERAEARGGSRGTGRVAARTRGLTKAYGAGDARVVALDGVDLDVEEGRFTAVMGPSGSGKSTLMHCAAGLDAPTAGEVWIGDTEIGSLKDTALTELRRDEIGFVFQAFNLIPTLTAQENILLPLSIAGRRPDQDWYRTVIDTVGLQDRLSHKPTELSGGQQQRVACARALVSRPRIVFADEPTGNLDSRSGGEVLAFLRRSVDEFGQTIVMVTHDAVAASWCDRVVFLVDGRIVQELDRPDRQQVLDTMAHLDDVVAARRAATEG